MDDTKELRAKPKSGASGHPAGEGLDEFEAVRHAMIESQLRRRGIRDEKVLEAMDTVPRHEFVPADFRKRSYDDSPLPIGEGQTISQPYRAASAFSKLEPVAAIKQLFCRSLQSRFTPWNAEARWPRRQHNGFRAWDTSMFMSTAGMARSVCRSARRLTPSWSQPPHSPCPHLFSPNWGRAAA
jgi:hypothetical protein